MCECDEQDADNDTADGKTVSKKYENSGTTYSVVKGGRGIFIAANGASTTYNPTAAVGNAGKGATIISNISYYNGVPKSTLTSGDVGYTVVTSVATIGASATVNTNTAYVITSSEYQENQHTSMFIANNLLLTGSTSSGFAPAMTAAPALVGAGIMAVLAM